MFKFIKEKSPHNHLDRTRLEMTTDSTYLPHVLEDFEAFLLASGFSIDGELDVVPKEENSSCNLANDYIQEESTDDDDWEITEPHYE